MQQRSLPSRGSLFVVTIAVEMGAWAAAAGSVGPPPPPKDMSTWNIKM